MAFGNVAKPSRIYTHKSRPPHEGAQLASDQLYRAHQYANALIETERQRWNATQDLMRSMFPRIAELEARIDAINAAIEAKNAAVKHQNQAARSRTATAEDRAEVKQLQSERRDAAKELTAERHRQTGVPKPRKEAWERIHAVINATTRDEKERKALRKAAQAAIDAGESPAPLTAEEDREAFGDPEYRRRRAAIDETANADRRAKRAVCEVYWGTYLCVEGAVDKSVEDCAKGQPVRNGKPPVPPGPPRFRRWSPEGKLGVQLQGGLSWLDALAGTDSRLRIELQPLAARPTVSKSGKPLPLADPNSRRSRENSQVVVWARIGTEEDGRSPIWMKTVAHLHRHPPADAVIKWVYLQRNLKGVQTWWEAQFVFEREEGWAKDRETLRGEAAIDLGWRKVADGLRVAVLIGDDGERMECVLPDSWLESWAKAQSIQGFRDTEFDAIRPALVHWLKARREAGTLPEWLGEATGSLHQWKSCERLGKVVWQWKDQRFDGDEAMFERLVEWRNRDRHLHNYARGMEETAVRRRDEHYHRWAALVRRRYALVKVEDTNWREMQHRPEATDDGKNATIGAFRCAAVGRLLETIQEHVWNVVAVEPAWTTKTCHACGHVDDFDSAKELVHTCSACGEIWDQDDNAARGLLKGRVLKWLTREGRKLPKAERVRDVEAAV